MQFQPNDNRKLHAPIMPETWNISNSLDKSTSVFANDTSENAQKVDTKVTPVSQDVDLLIPENLKISQKLMQKHKRVATPPRLGKRKLSTKTHQTKEKFGVTTMAKNSNYPEKGIMTREKMQVKQARENQNPNISRRNNSFDKSQRGKSPDPMQRIRKQVKPPVPRQRSKSAQRTN